MKNLFILLFSLLLTQNVYAQDTTPAITSIKKGDVAPYTGVLLSPAAIAVMITETKIAIEKSKLEIERITGISNAQCDFKLKENSIVFESNKKIQQSTIIAKEKEIEVLNLQLKKEKSLNNLTPLWLGISFISGVVLTIIISSAIN